MERLCRADAGVQSPAGTHPCEGDTEVSAAGLKAVCPLSNSDTGEKGKEGFQGYRI